jgi:hypothetical protein
MPKKSYKSAVVRGKKYKTLSRPARRLSPKRPKGKGPKNPWAGAAIGAGAATAAGSMAGQRKQLQRKQLAKKRKKK